VQLSAVNAARTSDDVALLEVCANTLHDSRQVTRLHGLVL
jgi:hypothetical protein